MAGNCRWTVLVKIVKLAIVIGVRIVLGCIMLSGERLIRKRSGLILPDGVKIILCVALNVLRIMLGILLSMIENVGLLTLSLG